MDSIGAEVGQKMRSAIKAKLMELDCYVDDELPDYIMVMVANRRTKSQMNEDLHLFLAAKTSTFVNWLHIVLKKLKEVTVTNPDVYKKAIKRKSAELPPDDKNSLKVKKEKVQKKVKNESPSEESTKQSRSITDDLPVSANKLLSENRKIIICNAERLAEPELPNDNAVESFDIPLLSDVNESVNEQELQDIEKKIRNVKSRLGLLVESDNEESGANVKTENGQLSSQTEDENANARQIHFLDEEIAGLEDRESYTPTRTASMDIELGIDTDKTEKKSQHTRITFQTSDLESAAVRSRLTCRTSRDNSRDRFTDRDRSSAKNRVGSKRRSILDRLGTRMGSPDRAKQKEGKHTGYQEFRKRSPSRDRDRSSWRSDRLGDRRTRNNSRNRKRSKSRERSLTRSKDRSNEREVKKEGILSRLGVQSKVAVIKKSAPVPSSDEEEEEQVIREVKSLIKVKPRVIPSDAAQPNKNLLLKAVADAQRSVAQTPKVGKEVKLDSLFTKKYQKKVPARNSPSRTKLRDLIKQSSSRMRSRPRASSDEYESDREYTPRPVKKAERDVPMYIPSSKSGSETDSKENDVKEGSKQQFIITLDGIDKLGFIDNKKSSVPTRPCTPPKKPSPPPAPIGSEKAKKVVSRPDIPDKLPIVRTPLSVKNKERCKYWPGCRQGDKCEFVHPTENCMMFPKCKYGEKCLYLHPQCKFGSSCTKRDCPYDHSAASTTISSKVSVVSAVVQNCKFYPNCANASSCPFYHPKPCKYGKFCKNISECVFSHSFAPNKKNMSWRSK